jgi:hypothetical protein
MYTRTAMAHYRSLNCKLASPKNGAGRPAYSGQAEMAVPLL